MGVGRAWTNLNLINYGFKPEPGRPAHGQVLLIKAQDKEIEHEEHQKRRVGERGWQRKHKTYMTPMSRRERERERDGASDDGQGLADDLRRRLVTGDL